MVTPAAARFADICKDDINFIRKKKLGAKKSKIYRILKTA
jgi:hypothetical protein